MRITRRQLQKLIKEEVNILNEEFDYDNLIEEIFSILTKPGTGLPMPYTLEIIGNKIMGYGIDDKGDVDKKNPEFVISVP